TRRTGSSSGWRSSTATSSARASSSCCGEPASPRRWRSTRPSRWRRSSAPTSRAASSTGSSIASTKSRRPLPEPRPPIRYAVISDVHANLEALTAVLADAASEGAHEVLCLGDLVGYGADPVACVERVGERASAMVAGNHEHAALGLLDLQWFNPWARTAAHWTAEQLDQGHRDYLTALSLVRTVEDATLVHASPRHPEEWDYLDSAEDGLQVFGDFATRLCFVGHSHLPGVWSVGSGGPDHAGRLDAPPAQVPLRHRPPPRRRCSSTTAGATWSTSAAWASRAIAIRAPATRSGTATRAT